MKLSDVTKRLHTPFYPEDLIPLEQLQASGVRERLAQTTGTKFAAWDKIASGVAYLEQPLAHFFISTDTLDPFCFFDGLTLIDIPSLEVGFLQSLEYKKRIALQQEHLRELRAEGNPSDLLVTCLIANPRIGLYLFQKLYDEIPDQQKYPVFREVYVYTEYGLDTMDDGLVRDVLKRAHTLSRKARPRTNRNGRVTIYRGVTSESRPMDRAYSWTTRFAQALFFATRYNATGSVLRAEVEPHKVIDYITERREDEVLLLPENVLDPESMPMLPLKPLIDELEQHGYLDMYKKFSGSAYLRPGLFQNPKDIHGLMHTKRVLMLVLMLCYLGKLRTWERTLLIHAALYHDIGRTNDKEEPDHGRQSFEKMLANDLCELSDPEEIELLRFVMENHCIGDAMALKRLSQYQLSDRTEAERLLNVFKDADALDRVRLGDLDLKFLRLPISHQLPLLACQLMNGIT